MSFEKVNDLYVTREFRGPTFFACHWSGWGFPDTNSNDPHRWHRPTLPIPADAKMALIYGMSVGGVLAGSAGFMMHVDFADPLNAVGSADDWSVVGNQGDFYNYFSTDNGRSPVGIFLVPVANSQALLRWKIMDDYNNAWGINLFCQGYTT